MLSAAQACGFGAVLAMAWHCSVALTALPVASLLCFPLPEKDPNVPEDSEDDGRGQHRGKSPAHIGQLYGCPNGGNEGMWRCGCWWRSTHREEVGQT